MPKLLHEYWENEDGGSFGPVRAETDQLRPILRPDARHVFSLHAASYYEAAQLYNDHLGYGDYVPAEGIADHFYTEEEAAEQQAYLKVRQVR